MTGRANRRGVGGKRWRRIREEECRKTSFWFSNCEKSFSCFFIVSSASGLPEQFNPAVGGLDPPHSKTYYFRIYDGEGYCE